MIYLFWKLIKIIIKQDLEFLYIVKILTSKGYGTEATKLAQKFAFEVLKLNRLELEVFSHNIRGIKAYGKAGFKIEGILRQAHHINQTYSDEIIMGILKEEYSKSNLYNM